MYVDLHVLDNFEDEYDLHGETLFPKHYPLVPPICNGMGQFDLCEKNLILKEQFTYFTMAHNGNIHHNVGFRLVPIIILHSLV